MNKNAKSAIDLDVVLDIVGASHATAEDVAAVSRLPLGRAAVVN